MKKRKGKNMVKYIVLSLVVILLIVLIIQYTRCRIAVKKGYEKLETYHAETMELSYGDMTYVDQGEGETVLSIHGIFGGYDQAFDTCKDMVGKYRIIAPSRFGYLGSDIMGEGTPRDQAKAYVELLDKLGIDKVYVLATSAGGTVAIRFALDYPERTKGLILFCSAMPYLEKPDDKIKYDGPPEFLFDNYRMWLFSPLFEPIMGMSPDTIYGMLPIEERAAGVKLDGTITNMDMARNFEEYPIETLQMPVLILHAKDDKLVPYEKVSNVIHRFPNCTKKIFEKGGHLMTGNDEEIKKAVEDFIQ